jgi:hypothetical protein
MADGNPAENTALLKSVIATLNTEYVIAQNIPPPDKAAGAFNNEGTAIKNKIKRRKFTKRSLLLKDLLRNLKRNLANYSIAKH